MSAAAVGAEQWPSPGAASASAALPAHPAGQLGSLSPRKQQQRRFDFKYNAQRDSAAQLLRAVKAPLGLQRGSSEAKEPLRTVQLGAWRAVPAELLLLAATAQRSPAATARPGARPGPSLSTEVRGKAPVLVAASEAASPIRPPRCPGQRHGRAAACSGDADGRGWQKAGDSRREQRAAPYRLGERQPARQAELTELRGCCCQRARTKGEDRPSCKVRHQLRLDPCSRHPRTQGKRLAFLLRKGQSRVVNLQLAIRAMKTVLCEQSCSN